ncbi:uncharacterized protein [Procambarus clarkii]|uniref:uncharacterized protein n=1 Tax=Procambarus clarkii TaxID=6728 RepID=UPI00374334BC
MLTNRQLVLVLQLLLAAAYPAAPATFIEGGCYRDAVLRPWVSVSGGDYSPEGLTPEICKNFCSRLHFWYCAADEGRYCYCLQTLGTLKSASGLCRAVCVDGSECGGLTPGLLTLWQTVVLTGNLNLTLNANTSLFPVGATVSVKVSATSSWVTNWGDGSVFITNGTNHTYTIPGQFTIVAFLELVPAVMDGATVTVVSKPDATLNCPVHVTVGEAAVCSLITSTQGYGSVLNITYTEPGTSQTSYHVPEEVSRVYGSILNVHAPAGTSRLLSTPTAFTLHSEGVHAGYLAAVRVMATTPGWLALYALSRGCASGGYCRESGECNTGCSPHHFKQTCSTFLCLPAGKCNGPACTTGTAPEASSYQYRFLYSFYVNVLNTVSMLMFDRTTVEVFEGEILAVGCLQYGDCSRAPLTIRTRPMHPTEAQDITVFYVNATTVTVTANITDKLLVSVSVREHEVVNMSYLVNCSTASSVPTALVPSPYTLSTSRYSLMGIFSLTYDVSTGELLP